jgi:hypothetical protein
VCDPCITRVNNQVTRNGNRINNLGNNLTALNTALQGIDLTLLQTINRKLGPEVNGGLSGWLKRFSNSLRLDRVMNVLNTMLLLHNAAQVSRSLLDSLSYFAESSLSLIGLKDEDSNPIDISGVVGNFLTTTVQSMIGEELYNGISEGWKKTSAIYTSAVNIYELTLSSMAGIAEGMEIVGEYTGKIGNALKKGGAVLENSYQWMDENIRIKTGRLGAVQNVIDGLQSAEDVVSNLTEATEEINETTENIQQIQEEYSSIRDKLKEKEEEKEEEETTGKTNSESPSISTQDLNRPTS